MAKKDQINYCQGFLTVYVEDSEAGITKHETKLKRIEQAYIEHRFQRTEGKDLLIEQRKIQVHQISDCSQFDSLVSNLREIKS